MFAFAHLGIGSKLVSPWSKGLPRRWILIGTLAPDLLDKSLYYGLSTATGRQGADLGLIVGTRTIGHTAIFLILVTFAAVVRKSKIVAALALGMATHLLLDNLSDRIMGFQESSATQALLFPLSGAHFAVLPFRDWMEHLSSFQSGPMLTFEVIGLGLLAWDQWKLSHRGEILNNFNFLRKFSIPRLRRKKPGAEMPLAREGSEL